MEYSNLFVCLMGIGTVFVGLICIVFLVMLMSAVCRKTERNTTAPAPAVTTAPVQIQTDSGKKPEVLAAIAAAIAEDMSTDISAVRIVSIKKV